MSTSRYSREQQRDALRRIGDAWEQLNAGHGMAPPVFQLHYNRNWGEWHPDRRIMSINARLAIDCRFSETLDTLRHEIAHQWVHEKARVFDESPHGPTWKRACVQFGANPRATAECQLEALAGAHQSARDARAVRKVKRLMALAESSNVHEAELAALRASEEMFKYQISEIELTDRRFGFRTVGKPVRRRPRWVFHIAHILSDHFHVHTIWLTERDREWDGDPATPGMLLELTGSPQAVEIAAYTYDFLVNEGARLVRSYQEQTGDRSAATKSQFLVGLYTGFQAKLDTQRKSLLKRRGNDPRSLALMQLGDPAREAFFRSRYPRIARTKTGGVARGDAFYEGRRHGTKLNLRGGVTTNLARGRLLSGRSKP